MILNMKNKFKHLSITGLLTKGSNSATINAVYRII